MTIEELVKEQIENLDIKSMVQNEIRRLISDDVKRELSKSTKESVDKIIKTEIEIQMSKGIKTDDGWGKQEKFDSFEQMFKQHFAKALNDKYEIQQVVKRHIESETKKLVDLKTKEIASALLSNLTNSTNQVSSF